MYSISLFIYYKPFIVELIINNRDVTNKLYWRHCSAASGSLVWSLAQVSVCVLRGFHSGSLVPSTFYKYVCSWLGYAKMHLGMNVCVYGAMQWSDIPFGLYSHFVPSVLTENEWKLHLIFQHNEILVVVSFIDHVIGRLAILLMCYLLVDRIVYEILIKYPSISGIPL